MLELEVVLGAQTSVWGSKSPDLTSVTKHLSFGFTSNVLNQNFYRWGLWIFLTNSRKELWCTVRFENHYSLPPFHFVDEEIETQKQELTCPESNIAIVSHDSLTKFLGLETRFGRFLMYTISWTRMIDDAIRIQFYFGFSTSLRLTRVVVRGGVWLS